MRYFLIILFMLVSLAGQCFAAEDQSAEGGDSTSQPVKPAPQGGDDKKKPAGSEKKEPAGGEEEPDCE
jgi:hypothetical protein